MAKKKLYVLTFKEWMGETTIRVYDTIEDARKVIEREVKSYLKKFPDWEIDYQFADTARVHLTTTFFDKNTTWKIEEAKNKIKTE